MSTSNSNLTYSREIRLSASNNPVAKKRCFYKNNIPLKKTSQLKQRKPGEHTAEKRQEPEEEPDTLLLKDGEDASNTTLARSCSSIMKPSVIHNAANKTRGEYSPASQCDVSRVSPFLQDRKERSITRQNQKSTSGRGKTGWILLLVMINILGVVQALTDCQIMHEFQPAIFDGSGSACCAQADITCNDGSWGRITHLYAALTNPI
jgi:hypothetical protein